MKSIQQTRFLKGLFLLFVIGLLPWSVDAQIFRTPQQFTFQDTLRGSNTPDRSWWNLEHYHLKVKVDPDTKSISGSNLVTYTVLDKAKRLQVELQEPMKLLKATQGNQELKIEKIGYSYLITPAIKQEVGQSYQFELFFEGSPVIAVRPPWDGGLTWNEDSNGLPFIANSNQGIGASIWWPNKDYPADEPDKGVLISVEVPENLMDVSNGRLIKTDHNKEQKTKTYHWEVTNPINNYGVNINIGDYVHFGEKYEGEKGTLDMDYYVLRENLKKAKKQFKDAPKMMEAFEYWFGPYPFYEDSYKLVETPYLGMEHQSSVTYGNNYANGYLGRDLSGTGWGMKFDFIIIHESGHEWFANNITYKDVADMWIHESFTAYSENLFLDYYYGKEASRDYVLGTRKNINNDIPIIGPYGVNQEGSGDMYYKGANMLHMIRQIVNDDEKWRGILRGLNKEFYHQTVSTDQVESFISQKVGLNLSSVFDQYLRDIRIPILSYYFEDGKLFYRWENAVETLNMPVKIFWENGEETWLNPSTRWESIDTKSSQKSLVVDPNFYVGSLNISGK
ncbi:M1 family metallopeptidase [Algoriphagus machipongonensis]|uniref:Aminopeptidase N n=1 Tax=Algoriphagus machipongonensis TaxID=388413 RepID=A3HS53_9BACT|nr:M1 family metallopeptidase [Algoriphagus machipongonensis]EAZ82671.1 aminopeptidase N [Algoriphagus machipongonensis]